MPTGNGANWSRISLSAIVCCKWEGQKGVGGRGAVIKRERERNQLILMQIDTKPVILLFIFMPIAVNKLIPDRIAGRSQWGIREKGKQFVSLRLENSMWRTYIKCRIYLSFHSFIIHYSFYSPFFSFPWARFSWLSFSEVPTHLNQVCYTPSYCFIYIRVYPFMWLISA